MRPSRNKSPIKGEVAVVKTAEDKLTDLLQEIATQVMRDCPTDEEMDAYVMRILYEQIPKYRKKLFYMRLRRRKAKLEVEVKAKKRELMQNL